MNKRKQKAAIGSAGHINWSETYQVTIKNKAMAPRYCVGETAYIDPTKPVAVGAFVLVRTRSKTNKGPLIGRLIKRSENALTLAQLSPAKEFVIGADEILWMHRVVGGSEAWS